MKQAIVFCLFSIALVASGLFGAFLAHEIEHPVYAAPAKAAKPPVPVICETVATAGAIVYYWCEPDDAPAFLANSMGFMQIAK